jgi:hypothetical protein
MTEGMERMSLQKSITLDEKFVEKQKTTLIKILLELQFSLMAAVS